MLSIPTDRAKSLLLTRTTVGLAASLLFLGLPQALAQAPEKSEAPPDAAQTAPPKDLPAAQSVIDDYIDALGGEKALKAVKSRKLSGSMSMGPQAPAITLTILSAAPNKMLLTATAAQFGSFSQGYDGKVAWSMDPINGPMILDGPMADQMADQAEFIPELSYAKRYKSMKCVDRKQMDGKDCFVVELIDKDDLAQIEYFDVQTHLLTATSMTRDTELGKMTIVSHVREFTSVHDIKIPTTIEIDSGGMVRTMKFDLAEINNVDPGVFKLPPEVEAIMQEDDAEEEPAPGEDKGDDDGDGDGG